MSTQIDFLLNQHQLIKEILSSRQKDVPNAFINEEQLSKSLISIFTELDERYFDLSNHHMEVKQKLNESQAQLETLQRSISQLKEDSNIAKKENVFLRTEINEHTAKIQEYQDKMDMNKQKMMELDAKFNQQQQLLSSQYTQISQLSNKCAELEHLKVNLEYRIKETSAEKDQLRQVLNQQIQQIDNVRQRQKTKIDHVTHKAQQYYSQIETITDYKDELERQIIEYQGEITKLKDSLEAQMRFKRDAANEKVQLQRVHNELKEKVQLLEDRQKELKQIKQQCIYLKQKESDFDHILQTLSLQKSRLDEEVTRLTTEARRKMSETSSVNTDHAIENISGSFLMHSLSIGDNPKLSEDRGNLNRSFQQIISRKMSTKELKIEDNNVTRSFDPVEAQFKIRQLEVDKIELQKVITQLKDQIEQNKNIKLIQSQSAETMVSPNKEDRDIVLNGSNICESREEQKQFTVEKYQISIRPEIRLLSLYSMQGSKLFPRVKTETFMQTQKSSSFENPYSNKLVFPIKMSLDELEISNKSAEKRELGFFDKLTKMFCGGSSE